MDFLANENFPLVSIQLLRNAGHNVKSVAEDMPGSNDHEVLACASERMLVILTFDRDYGELVHRHTMPAPAGIVYFRSAPSCSRRTCGSTLGDHRKRPPKFARHVYRA